MIYLKDRKHPFKRLTDGVSALEAQSDPSFVGYMPAAEILIPSKPQRVSEPGSNSLLHGISVRGAPSSLLRVFLYRGNKKRCWRHCEMGEYRYEGRPGR
jgi:hypothetical protein